MSLKASISTARTLHHTHARTRENSDPRFGKLERRHFSVDSCWERMGVPVTQQKCPGSRVRWKTERRWLALTQVVSHDGEPKKSFSRCVFKEACAQKKQAKRAQTGVMENRATRWVTRGSTTRLAGHGNTAQGRGQAQSWKPSMGASHCWKMYCCWPRSTCGAILLSSSSVPK